jgi:FkbM family methyltransferase
LIKRIATHLEYLADSMSACGVKGAYAYLLHVARSSPGTLPQLYSFGTFRDRNEFENILDNFILGRLRVPQIEQLLNSSAPIVIVDCGVNVGVTVRWWLSRNNAARVVGIDMMREALNFTKEQLGRENPDALSRFEPVEAALGSSASEITISFDNPLDGENSVGGTGQEKRTVQVRTLDEICDASGVESIDLIKLDIEGAGSDALVGGARALSRTRYLIAEHHSAAELSGITQSCSRAGMSLLAANEKMVLFGR